MIQVFAAVKAIVKNENRILIIKQQVNNVEIWDLPGGRVDYGESPYDTLHRELKEEVCLEVNIIAPVGLWWFFRTHSDNAQVICNTFICEPKNHKVDISQNPALETIVEFRWVTKEEVLTDDYRFSHDSLKQLIENCSLI